MDGLPGFGVWVVRSLRDALGGIKSLRFDPDATAWMLEE
jgi:hypothetical protein